MSNEVKPGAPIPDVELMEGNPDTKVKLSELLASGPGLIVGVPAAFSPACSDTHIPGYIDSEKAKSFGPIYVVAVNDPFVTNAWGKKLHEGKSASGIRFLADPAASFTKALGVEFDATAVLGNVRSKRYAIKTRDGKIEEVNVEPDKFGVKVSAVENVLG